MRAIDDETLTLPFACFSVKFVTCSIETVQTLHAIKELSHAAANRTSESLRRSRGWRLIPDLCQPENIPADFQTLAKTFAQNPRKSRENQCYYTMCFVSKHPLEYGACESLIAVDNKCYLCGSSSREKQVLPSSSETRCIVLAHRMGRLLQ